MIFYDIGPSPPSLLPPGGAPGGGLRLPSIKIKIIFEIYTNINPIIDISYEFLWFRTKPPLPPPWGLEAPLGGSRVPQKENRDHF